MGARLTVARHCVRQLWTAFICVFAAGACDGGGGNLGPAAGADGSSGGSEGEGSMSAAGVDEPSGWEAPAASLCSQDGIPIVATFAGIGAYRAADDELYILTSDERNGVAWGELEVSPASGGPGRLVARVDLFADSLDVYDGAAYFATRSRRITAPSDTHADWEIRRVTQASLEPDTLLTGNFGAFSVGPSGLLVWELSEWGTSQLVFYTTDSGERRPVCTINGFEGAVEEGDYVVWWNYKSIWVCPLKGGTNREIAPETEKDLGSLSVVADASHVYWTSGTAPGIGRASLSSDGTTEMVFTETARNLVLDAEYLYFSSGGIQRMRLADLVVEQVSDRVGRGFQVAGEYLYYTEYVDYQQVWCIKRVPKPK